jgi:hypothetical protein
MFLLSSAFKSHLVTFLLWSSVALLVLFVFVLSRRAVEVFRDRRRARFVAHYRPAITRVLTTSGQVDAAAVAMLRAAPSRHAALIGELLIAPLRVAHGSTVDAARQLAETLGILAGWEAQLDARWWWKRAEAARSLGLLRVAGASPALVRRLDDAHEEVRAAAVDALGRLGDPLTVSALVARLPDATRHQRARLVETLREIGPGITPELLVYARSHYDQIALVADLIGLTGASGAMAELVTWADDPRPSVRSAAWRALGSIGLDDRSYYYALRALGDDDAETRAMAARALGRCRRAEAAPDLARLLNDEWIVAAHAATGLRALGDAGRAELAGRQHEDGLPGLLARQMLWERQASA